MSNTICLVYISYTFVKSNMQYIWKKCTKDVAHPSSWCPPSDNIHCFVTVRGKQCHNFIYLQFTEPGLCKRTIRVLREWRANDEIFAKCYKKCHVYKLPSIAYTTFNCDMPDACHSPLGLTSPGSMLSMSVSNRDPKYVRWKIARTLKDILITYTHRVCREER